MRLNFFPRFNELIFMLIILCIISYYLIFCNSELILKLLDSFGIGDCNTSSAGGFVYEAKELWMNSEVFTRWLMSLFQVLETIVKKLDNVPTHSPAERLKT